MEYQAFTDPSLIYINDGHGLDFQAGYWYYTPIDLSSIKKLDPWIPQGPNPMGNFHVLITLTGGIYVQKTHQIIDNDVDIVYLVWTPDPIKQLPPLNVSVHIMFLCEHSTIPQNIYSGVMHKGLNNMVLPFFSRGQCKFSHLKPEILWHIIAPSQETPTDSIYAPPLPNCVKSNYYGVCIAAIMPLDPFEILDVNLGRFFCVHEEMANRPFQWSLTAEASVQGLEIVKEYTLGVDQHLWVINKSKIPLRINLERLFLIYLPKNFLTMFTNIVQ
jgi:hypothetical protein